MEDPYRTLGLAADASRAEIKAALRRCALEFHPDRHSRSPAPVRDWALSRFKQASDAYELLLDDSRRAAYDRRRGDGRFHRSRGYGNGYGGGGGRTWSASGGGKGVEWEAVFRYLTSRRFALNLLLASALLGGTLVIEKGGEAMWKLNNSGKSFEAAMHSIEKSKAQKDNG